MLLMVLGKGLEENLQGLLEKITLWTDAPGLPWM
jgi:hypothetical protein